MPGPPTSQPSLTVLQDIDGVLLDHLEARWARGVVPYLRFLVETEEIRVIWSTAWYTEPDDNPDPLSDFLDPDEPYEYGMPDGILEGEWRLLLEGMRCKFEFFPWLGSKVEILEQVSTPFLMIDDDLGDEEHAFVEELDRSGGSVSGRIVDIDLAHESHGLAAALSTIRRATGFHCRAPDLRLIVAFAG